MPEPVNETMAEIPEIATESAQGISENATETSGESDNASSD